MITVNATVENAAKIRRIAVKHNLTGIDTLDKIFDASPRETHIPGFNFTLKEFQAEGVAIMEKFDGRVLLADEPGCGKTVQVMAYAHKHKKFPMAVICPSVLKFNWRDEILAMTGSQYRINIVGQNMSQRQKELRAAKYPNVVYSKTCEPNCDIYIINYDIVDKNIESLEEIGFKFVALDESHKCKNEEALRTVAVKRLVTGYKIEDPKNKKSKIKITNGVNHVCFMSGTPILNRPIELWTTLETVAPWVPDWNFKFGYAVSFCGAKRNSYGWDFNGCTQPEKLNQLLLNNLMIRRLKRDVLQELPSKTFKTVALDFPRKEYDTIAAAFSGNIDWKQGIEAMIEMGGNPAKSNEAIVAIQKLREVAGVAKIPSTIQWISDFCESGEKLVVFAHNRKIIEDVRSGLLACKEFDGEVRVIYGGMSNEDRASAVHDFQNNNKVKVILLGITTAEVGLTLTAASNVAFIQLPWSPALVQQASDRVHRIGQTQAVTVYNLIADNTIEEDIAAMIMEKGLVMDSVIDDGKIVNQIVLD